jgi:hypothetical protein
MVVTPEKITYDVRLNSLGWQGGKEVPKMALRFLSKSFRIAPLLRDSRMETREAQAFPLWTLVLAFFSKEPPRSPGMPEGKGGRNLRNIINSTTLLLIELIALKFSSVAGRRPPDPGESRPRR